MKIITIDRAVVEQAQKDLEFFRDTAVCSADADIASAAITALRAALAEPMQKPVAWQWLDTGHFRKKIPVDATPAHWRPLYTTPPQRKENEDD